MVLVAAADIDRDEREGVEEKAVGRLQRQLEKRLACFVEGAVALAVVVVGDGDEEADPGAGVEGQVLPVLFDAGDQGGERLPGLFQLTEQIALAAEEVAAAALLSCCGPMIEEESAQF